jgi:hypothetical protein
MDKLKYNILLDYTLSILSTAKNSGFKYVSLVSVVKSLQQESSFSDIQEIGKYLDTMGWAKVIFSLGDVKAQITSKGLVYLEGKSEDFEKEYEGYLNKLLQAKNETNEQFIIAIATSTNDPKDGILKNIDTLIAKIKVHQGEQSDLLKDLEVVKIELSKSFPDIQLIEIKLNKLSTLEYVSADVQELKDYLLVPAN